MSLRITDRKVHRGGSRLSVRFEFACMSILQKTIKSYCKSQSAIAIIIFLNSRAEGGF